MSMLPEPHTHWWFEEDRFIVVDVQQRHLQRLCGLIRHRLTHVAGHDYKLRESFSTQLEGEHTCPHELRKLQTHCADSR